MGVAWAWCGNGMAWWSGVPWLGFVRSDAGTPWARPVGLEKSDWAWDLATTHRVAGTWLGFGGCTFLLDPSFNGISIGISS